MKKVLDVLLGAAMFAALVPMPSFASRKTINLDSVYRGRITRNSNDRDAKQFIFYDDATHMNYFLDNNRVGRVFRDQEVQITGRIGRHDTMKVDVVQPLGQVNPS